jgi:hypothetical protein
MVQKKPGKYKLFSLRTLPGKHRTLDYTASFFLESLPHMRLPLPEGLFVRPAFCIRLFSDSISQWTPLPSLTVLFTRARKGLLPSSLTTYRSHTQVASNLRYFSNLGWSCLDSLRIWQCHN